MNVRRAPKFVRMAGSALKPDAKSIDLLFLAEDGQHYAVELAPDVIAPMLTTIAGLSNDLRATLPNPDDLPTQALDVTDFRVAMNPAGQIGWQLVLASGVSVVLQFDPDQFAALDARLTDFRDLLSRKLQ